MMVCPEWSSPPAWTLPVVHCSPAARLAARAPRQLLDVLLSVWYHWWGSWCATALSGHRFLSCPLLSTAVLAWADVRYLGIQCCCTLFLVTGASRRAQDASPLWADAEGQRTCVRQVGCLGRCEWLLFAEGNTAGELRSALGGCSAEATRGAFPGPEGHGAVATRGSACAQPRVLGYPAVGVPQSRVVITEARLPGLAGE